MPAAVCGSDAGYQGHRSRGEVPCDGCSSAHALTMAWYRVQDRPDNPLLYAAARAGKQPVEALTTEDRARLITELATRGWTDVRIAEHTRQTTYTTARIRDRLGLAANVPQARAVA
jgi:hypothetical protein